MFSRKSPLAASTRRFPRKRSSSGINDHHPSSNLIANFSNLTTQFFLHSDGPDQDDQTNTVLDDQIELTDFQYEQQKGDTGRENAVTSHPNTLETQSVSQFLERFRPVRYMLRSGITTHPGTPIPWTASDARGSCIASIDPLRSIIEIPSCLNKLQNFARLNCSATVRFQVTGNQFYAGKLMAVWIPPNRYGNFFNYNVTEVELMRPTFTMVSGIPNQVSMYPSYNETVELKIPLLQPNSYFDTKTFATQPNWIDADHRIPYASSNDVPNLGTVNVYVITPFRGQDPTATAHISVWVKWDNVDIPPVYSSEPFAVNGTHTVYRLSNAATQTGTQLVQPFGYLLNAVANWTHDTFAPAPNFPPELQFHTLDGVTAKVNEMHTEFASRQSQVKNLAPGKPREAAQKEQGGFLSRAAKTVSNISGTLAMIPGPTAPFATAASAVSGLMGSVFSALNLDKPREVSNPQKVMLTFKNLNTGDGLDQTNHLGLLSNNRAEGPGPNQSSQINPKLSEICAIPQIIHNATVPAVTVPESIIWQWAVSPINVPSFNAQHVTTSLTGSPILNPGTAERCQITSQHTFLSKIASMFQFWRGTMVLDFEFICTSFTRAQFLIIYDPNASMKNPNDYSPNLSNPTDWHTQYVLINGNTKVRFEIPYQSKDWVCSNQINEPTMTAGASTNVRLFNGMVTLVLINPITSFGMTEVLDMDVLISASMKDPQFFRPTGKTLSNTRGQVMYHIYHSDTPGLELHSLGAGDGSTDISSIKRIKDVDLLNPSSFFGEFSDSLEMLIRRDGFIGEVLPQGSEAGANIIWKESLFATDTRSMDAISVNVLQTIPPSDYYSVPQWSTNSFLLYLSEIFLEWRGDVSYLMLNAAAASPPYLISNEENFQATGVVMNPNGPSPFVPHIVDPLIFPISIPARALPATWRPLNTLSDGAYYRPQNNDGIPACVSTPFYNPNGFLLTQDFFFLSNPETDFVWVTAPYTSQVPGIKVEQSDYPTTVIAHACDDFQLSRLYPPNITTRYFTTTFETPVVLQPQRFS